MLFKLGTPLAFSPPVLRHATFGGEMRLKTLAMAAVMTLGLTSCDDFSGQFSANQELKLVHTTIFGNKKTKKVPMGKYKATLGFSSANKVKLTLKEDNGDNISVKIKLPENRQFPTFTGKIDLPASQTGQKYDLKGKINTEVTRGAPTSTYESCTYTRYVRKCERVCDAPVNRDGDVVRDRRDLNDRRNRNCRRTCRQVPVSVSGTRDVTYHYTTTYKRIKLGVFNPGSNGRLGAFKGDLTDTDKVYDFYGKCF